MFGVLGLYNFALGINFLGDVLEKTSGDFWDFFLIFSRTSKAVLIQRALGSCLSKGLIES